MLHTQVLPPFPDTLTAALAVVGMILIYASVILAFGWFGWWLIDRGAQTIWETITFADWRDRRHNRKVLAQRALDEAKRRADTKFQEKVAWLNGWQDLPQSRRPGWSLVHGPFGVDLVRELPDGNNVRYPADRDPETYRLLVEWLTHPYAIFSDASWSRLSWYGIQKPKPQRVTPTFETNYNTGEPVTTAPQNWKPTWEQPTPVDVKLAPLTDENARLMKLLVAQESGTQSQMTRANDAERKLANVQKHLALVEAKATRRRKAVAHLEQVHIYESNQAHQKIESLDRALTSWRSAYYALQAEASDSAKAKELQTMLDFATKRAEEAEAETRRWFEAFNSLEREQVKRELVDTCSGKTYTEDQVSEIVRTYEDQAAIIDDYHDREVRIREVLSKYVGQIPTKINSILDAPTGSTGPRNPL